jgi:hypothetical protein
MDFFKKIKGFYRSKEVEGGHCKLHGTLRGVNVVSPKKKYEGK